MTRVQLVIIAASVLLLAGLTLGWYLFRPEPPKPETYAHPITLKGGAQVLERKPQANARPAHKVPSGAAVERVVRVSVAPKEIDLTAPGAHSAECPALDVDLSLVRLPDDSRRVIASSPNGEIVGGVDIPVESAAPYKGYNWLVGGGVNLFDKGWEIHGGRKIADSLLGVTGPVYLGPMLIQREDRREYWMKGDILFD